MEINEYVRMREQLERQLHTAIQDAFDRFHEATGVSPRSVDVRMTDVSVIGDKRPRCIVEGVTVYAPI